MPPGGFPLGRRLFLEFCAAGCGRGDWSLPNEIGRPGCAAGI